MPGVDQRRADAPLAGRAELHHPARVEQPGGQARPADRAVFDLDPTQEDFGVVREGALAVAEVLRELGVTPFAMVTGSRGIHVYAPLKRTRTADEIRAAAQAIAEQVVERSPETLTTAWRK